MSPSVKIRTLPTPQLDSGLFDPGEYLGGLDFYETDEAITDADRDGLAQLVHFLAFMALQAQSPRWPTSVVRRDSLAYRALESHFGQLDGWTEVSRDEAGVSYRALAGFLMEWYPPHQ